MTSQMSPKDFPYPQPEVITDPYPFYEAMRTTEPVYREPNTGIYFVSRYEDVIAVAQNPDLFSSQRRAALASPDPEVQAIRAEGFPDSISVTAQDPPEHGRFRSLALKVLSPKRLLALEPKIRALANDLVDQFITNGTADLTRQFAGPLPLTVIADLLGLDDQDVPDIKRWSDDWTAQIGAMSCPLSRPRTLECARSTNSMQHYFSRLLEERTANPGEDAISLLIKVNQEAEEPITHEQLVDMLRVFIIGGNDTTTNAITTLTYRLLEKPEYWTRLSSEPRLISTVIEEGLRFESPAQWNLRVVTRDTELGGTQLPAGAVVCMLWGSANRDKLKFDNAGAFDPGRAKVAHVAFGFGVHFCVGAPLARLELKITMETFAARLRNLRLAPGDAIEFRKHPILRGMERLCVEFDPGQIVEDAMAVP